MDLAPGTLLTPQLQLTRRLGRGSMGEVWAAVHLEWNAAVAVKLMRANSPPDQIHRFLAEASGLARLSSPHLVRIHDVGRYTAYGSNGSEEPYIVMELLNGEDLRARIERQGPLAPPMIAAVIDQVCRALAAAHAAGVIHRDIKPANIFLHQSPDAGVVVKVLDFGVAKFTMKDLGLTRSSSLVGTPSFASPEQLLNPKLIDHRTDLWSTAVVTYVALTGRLPFNADTYAGLSLAIHKGTFSPPRSFRSALPPAIDAWMKRGLATTREARFSSAAELGRSLAQVLSQWSPPPVAAPRYTGGPDEATETTTRPRLGSPTMAQTFTSAPEGDAQD